MENQYSATSRNNLKTYPLKIMSVLTLFILFSHEIYGQATLPSVSSIPFSFSSYSGTSFPASLSIGRETGTTLTTADIPNDAPNGSGAGAWQAESANGISFRGNNGTSSNQRGCFQIRVNSTGQSNVKVNWTARTITNDLWNSSKLDLQWRNGSAGTWNNVSGFTYTSGSTTTFSATLPAGANNLSDLRIRWVYYDGTYINFLSNTRDRVAIDDISVCVSPSVSASSNTPVCIGSTLNLSSTNGMSSYQWAGPNSFTSTSQNPSITNVSLAAAGTYTVTVTSGGCSASATTSVVVNQAPTGNATSNSTSICEGNSVDLSANMYLSNTYSANPNTVITDNNATGINSIISVPAQTLPSGSRLKISITLGTGHTWVGDLIAKVTSPCGTTTVFDRPGVPATTSGSDQNMTGTYVFDLNATNVLPETNSGPTVIPTGSYRPSLANGSANTNWNGFTFPCSAGGNWTLNMSDRASGDVGTLVSWSVIILTNTGVTYSWSSTPSGFSSSAENPTDNPIVTTSYTVMASGAGCTNTSSVTVNVNASPSPSVSSNAPICDANDIFFSADNLAPGQSSGNTYVWQNPSNVVFSTQQNPSISSATAASNGIYTVTITNQFLCTASSTTSVVVNPNPTLSVTNQQNAVCFGESNGSLEITASNGTPNYTYTMDFISFNQDGIFSNLAAGAYGIYVSDDNGCSGFLNTTISEPALLSFSSGSTNEICPGASDGSITVNATGGTLPYQYSINNGASFSALNSFIGLSPAVYDVLVKDDHNCITPVNNINIILENTPSTAASSVSSSAGFNICAGNSTVLEVLGGSLGSGASWKWYSSSCSGSPVGTGVSLNVNPLTSTNYFVRAEDICGSTICVNYDLIVSSSAVTANVIVPFVGMPTNICNGTTANLSVPSVNKATQYIWDAPTGSYFDGNPLNISPFITTSPNVTITYGSPSGSLYSTGVQASNACGSSVRKIQKTRGIVSVPASVSGASTVCENSVITYTTPDVDGASSYLWSITGDATVSGNTNSVTVTFGPTWNGGTLCVAAQTSCYTSPAKCLAISKSAAPLANLSGNFTACPNANQTFSVNPSVGAASYIWNLPPGTFGSSSTNSINVHFNSSYNSAGNICVSVTSICGVTSAPKCKTVAPGLPSMPSSVTGPLNGLCGQTVVYQCPTQGGTTFNWSVPSGANINSGQGTNAISVTYSTFSTAPLCVIASNSCGSSAARCVTAKAAPASPASLTAVPSSWCANTPGIEFTANVSNITGSYSLNWLYPSAPTANYVLGGGNSSNLILDWGSGNGNVVVVASNACGSGSKQFVATVSCREDEKLLSSNVFDVFPNPASSIINVQISALESAPYTIKLVDLSGRTLLSELVDAKSGLNTWQLDIKHMAKGAYMLSINGNKVSQTQRIILE